MLHSFQETIEIGLACEADVPGIHALMLANVAANGGRLSASFSPAEILAMQQTLPMIVARREGLVVGFLMASSREAGGGIPIIRTMLEAYRGAENAYVYGPICVDSTLRGRGLAQAMFAELRRRLPGREGILFVRQDNEASLRAHRKMGLREVAEFDFRDCVHSVFAYGG